MFGAIGKTVMRRIQRWFHPWQGAWARPATYADYACAALMASLLVTACGARTAATPATPVRTSEPAPEDDASGEALTPPSENAIQKLPQAPALTCIPQGGPVIDLKRTPTDVELQVSRDTPTTWAGADLPLASPTLSGLPADWVPAAGRTTVITQAGILIALNAGDSADSGLHWLEKGKQRPQRVTSPGANNVRWVFPTTFGIIGIENKCQNACPGKTAVFKLTPTRHYKAWKLKRTAELDGCPSALSLANSDELFIASACSGTLHRVDRKGVVAVVEWPKENAPVQLVVHSDAPNARSKAVTTPFVNFGNAVAKFTPDQTEWYAARSCSRVVLDDSNRTQPSPSAPSCRCE